ncbi:hypothetical protein PC112_g11523 [Phytophthora cactorum]|nr:hypothetical protein PC112_g11523 [Phytophthora cactorum]
MEEASFAHSGDIFSLTDKSGYQIPYYIKTGGAAGENVGHRRRLPRSYSTHSVLHETNRSHVYITGSAREHIPFVTKSVHMRECLAEFLGTLVFLCFGIGVNNQVVFFSRNIDIWTRETARLPGTTFGVAEAARGPPVPVVRRSRRPRPARRRCRISAFLDGRRA